MNFALPGDWAIDWAVNWELFHFLRPLWLLALIPLFALVALLARRYGGGSDWRRVVAAELLPHVLQSGAAGRRALPLGLLALAGVLSIVALAGPTWERVPQPVFRETAALVIALDLSRSMDAEDIKPSRLQRAKFKVTDILRVRSHVEAGAAGGGHTALVVYAADAFTVSPLTDDAETIIAQLPALDTALMPVQGSRVDRALALGTQLLRQAGQAQGHILLITDGAPAGVGTDSAGQVATAGYQLSILGLGTADGAPIPAAGGILKDRAGNIVITALDEPALRQIAAAGGGRYAAATVDDSDIAALALHATAAQTQDEADDDRVADIWKETGPWLLLPVLPIAALAFRRGLLALAMCALVPALLSWPPAAAAQGQWWRDLWHTPNEQAQQLFDADKPEQAAKRYTDPAWRATAHYRAGDYEQALAGFRALSGAGARYNEGNALAKLGRLRQALEAYSQTLAAAPDHADAAYNKKLIEEALRQAEQQQQSADGEQGEQGEPSDAANQSGGQGDAESSGGDGEQSQDQSGEPQDQTGADEQSDTTTDDPTPQDGEAEAATESQANPTTPTPTEQDLTEEQAMARHQWLMRIPDDPGGLLKRKFQHQYRQRARTDPAGQPW